MARYDNCIQRLIEAAGRQLTDREVEAIFERIHKAALDIKAGRVDPADVKLGGKLGKEMAADGIIQEAAQRAAADLVKEAETRERQAALQITKIAARGQDAFAAREAGLDPLEAVKRVLTRDYSGKVNIESLEQRVAGVKGDLERKLLKTWDALGNDFLGFFQDREKLLNLVKELRGDDTGDSLAKQGAKAFHDVAEEARQIYNANGGVIGKLDDWGMPQHHSQEKVSRAAEILTGQKTDSPEANRKAWVDYMLPKLLGGERYVDDLGRPWDEARMREFLDKAWTTVATDGIANMQIGGSSGSGKRANRHSESRQIHFKNADDVIDYWQTFGDKSAVEILHGHIETMAKDIAFIEKLGPNPDMTYRVLRDQAVKDAAIADPQKTETINGRASRLDALYDYAAGKIRPSANATFSSVMDGIGALNSAGKLGGAMLASLFGDKPMYEAVSHLNNIPAVQRWQAEISMLNPANAADRRLLAQQGLMAESIRSGLNRFYEGLGASSGASQFASTTSKIANAVMRVTGMTAVNDLRKSTFGLNLFSSIGEQLAAGKEFKDLHESDVRALKNYGITEADWGIWKQAQLEDMKVGSTVLKGLTPESIARIPDTTIERIIPDRLQGIRDSMQAQIDKLDLRNQKEEGWIAKRAEKFQAAQDAAAKRIGKLAVAKDEKSKAIAKSLELKIELLKAEIDRVRVRTDIEAAFANEKNADKVRGLMADVHRATNEAADYVQGADSELSRLLEGRGDNVTSAVGRANETIGYNYGMREGALTRRIVELEGKIRDAEKGANADLMKADKAESKRIESLRSELAEFWSRSQMRQERRQAVMDRIAADIDPKIQQEITATRREAIVKLLGAVNTESEFAIVTPGWSERAQFYSGLAGQRGTVMGEIARSVLQFKSFPWAMFQRSLDLVANGETPASKAALSAWVIVSTTLAGAMLMQTREMLAGKDPRKMVDDRDWWKFWGQAFLQGGALGIYGDFLYGANQTRYGSGPLETMAGPTIGPLLELGIVQPMNAAKKQIEGKQTHLAAQELQDLKGFVPGGNIWYAKAALDHLIFHQVFDYLSPGYLANMQSRTLKDYQQDWWWRPGEVVPERAPDFSQAVAR